MSSGVTRLALRHSRRRRQAAAPADHVLQAVLVELPDRVLVQLEQHDRRAAVAAINAGTLDVAFVRYNSAHPGAQRDVFPLLEAARRTRVLGFTSTGGHHPVSGIDPDVWIPDITDHYRFALSQVGLDGLLCSPTEPRHVDELVAAMERGPLSLEEEEHMIELAAMTNDA
jgi:hypothetical protein